MIQRYISLIAAIMLVASCSKIDNYASPGGGIYGTLTDKITGKPLQSQQPNGFTVQLFEEGKSSNVPIVIPGKQDGTFENSFIFEGQYKIAVIEGAFFPVEPRVVEIGKHTEANFDVMPFLAVVDALVTPANGKITVNYKIVREQESGKILERRTLVSKIPTVNSVAFDFQSQSDLSQTPDADILAGAYTDEVNGLTSGETYYVRVAVRTKNALNKYNYSEAFKVTIP